MGLIDHTYLKGVTSALVKVGACYTDKVDAVAKLAELKLREKFVKSANVPGAGGGADATPQELNQVTQSGLTENDIQSAAKVVQVIAEMKQQADSAAMGMPQMPGAAGMTPVGQPPLPAPPQGPMGGMSPGMMPPGMMPPGANGGM